MSKFWSPQIHGLVPYTPGEQPKIDDLVKLNTNESPYPPAPGVADVLRDYDTERLRLYPDPDASELKTAIADKFNVEPTQVFVGNGSDEVLAHAFMAFFRQDKPLLKPEITYSFYEVYANLYDIELVNLPLTKNFDIDLNDFNRPNGGIIFANPNAPTGKSVGISEIESLLVKNRDTVIIVDEAYVDFGAESAIQLCDRFDNLLVVHTFSKSRALAGLRIGYAIGHPDLIEGLDRVKNSFNSYPIDSLAIKAGCASLADESYFRDSCDKIISTRQQTQAALEILGFRVFESSANFLFVEHRYIEAAELMGYLRSHGILVRHFSRPKIANFLRITIGTNQEMSRLLETLENHPDLVKLPIS